MRRTRFIGLVVVTGLRWARSVVDESLVLLSLVTLTAGVTVGGVLLHRPGWFLGVFGALIALVILVEGAYRVHEASQASGETVSTEPDADAVWLSEQLAQGNALLERWTPHLRLDREGNIVMEIAVWERLTREGLTQRLPE